MNAENKSVSIVIPTFNRAKLLLHTIDACLKQTYPVEIIVCDHGSSDNTPELMKQYSSNVIYIRKDKDFGPHFCWLDGILNASSDYVHLQFDDDWIKPTYVEECMTLFDNDVGFVYSAAEVCVDQDKQAAYKLFFHPLREIPHEKMLLNKRIVERSLLRGVISPGAIIIRKEDAINALYQGELPFQKNAYHGVGPDLLYTLLTLLKYNKFGYIKKTLAVFRSHDESITIDAFNDPKKQKRIELAYNEAKKYYFRLKFFKNFNVCSLVLGLMKLKIRLMKLELRQRILPVVRRHRDSKKYGEKCDT